MGLFSRSNARLGAADPSALLGAAAPIQNQPGNTYQDSSYESWQNEAWQMYDDLGEYRQGVKWLSNVLSRARLIPAIAPARPGDEPTPIDPDTNDPAVGLVEDIAHGIGGQSELLRSATVHLTVPGEGYFVGKVDNSELSWKFYSKDEYRKNRETGRQEVKSETGEWSPLPEESLPVRVWRPHDRYHWKADSSSRAALPIMRRLQLLNRRVDAEVQSRLAMNGMTWIPFEMTFPINPDYAEADDPFIAELIDTATTAIKTPGSAAAAIPLFLRAKGEDIKNVTKMDFSSLVNPELRADREFEIKRLATALDVPPEVLLGMLGMNHWGAWQVEESALKTTVTNLLEMICWSLTTGYLRPALAAMKATPVPLDQNAEVINYDQDRIVWFDVSELAVRQDRSSDTITLRSQLIVNNEATMRETGLEETDLLIDPDELRKAIGLKLCESPSAATLEIGLELLGISTVAKVVQPGMPGQAPVAPVDEPAVPPGSVPADDAPQAPPPTQPGANGNSPVPAAAPAG